MNGGGSLALSIGITPFYFALVEKYLGYGSEEPLWQITKRKYRRTKEVMGQIWHGLWNARLPENPEIRRQIYVAAGIGAFGLGISAVLQAYQTKIAYNHAVQVRDAVNYLQTRLISAGTIVDTCKQLQSLAFAHKPMEEGLLKLGNIDLMLNGEDRSVNFEKLVDLLQTNTFKDYASFFSLSGRVLAAHRLMTEEKDEFTPALAAMGEIDACLSMAKLHKKNRESRVGYCFTEFVETDKPYMKLVDFWNPFINPEVVVTNSLTLGKGAEASKVILTGSNTGGKSTILKATLILNLLSRSYGMAPARACTLSPFGMTGCFMKVNDDTAAGESKFKAEVTRAKLLCETMDALPANQFGFIVIDELFTGTNANDAINAAKKVAEKLAKMDNNIYIMATHFPPLTELEKQYKGLIKNYKVEVTKNAATGKLIRKYKLEPGISTQNVANDILNEEIGGIDFGA